MLHRETSGAISPCPTVEELRAYGDGRLARERLEAIAEHVDRCPQCESSLREGSAVIDTLVSRLRKYVPAKAREVKPPVDHAHETTKTFGPKDRETASWPGSPRHATVEGDAQAPPFAKRFGPYELIEPLARGGMGVVYKARQIQLNRIVAVKMIRAGEYARPEERARFRIEAEAIARLKHPHVVQIHEFSEVDDQPYFSMEYMEGGSLERKLDGKPLPEREAAELLRTLAQAVHAAHECHIVHRDLKPGNVLLTADGIPKVSDFGLAKLLDTEGGQTHTDAVMGTPSYMAPEQARGEGKKIGPATDIFALGAILYKTLTGRPPFRGDTRLDTLAKVKNSEPEPLSSSTLNLSSDLEAICRKCLEKEPGARYPTALALSEDLGRWLRGEPTLARPLRWVGRLQRRLWRHPIATALVGVCFLACIAVAGVLHYTDPERPRRDIERRLARGETVTLIGERGSPRWSQWRTGGDAAQTSLAEDGTFTIHTWKLSLLELVRDPGRDRYRIRAEVWHRNSGDGGQVGIYCAHREFATVDGGIHRFIRLSFNEVQDARERHAEMQMTLQVELPPPKGNAVEFNCRLYREGVPGTYWDRIVSGQSYELFMPTRGGVWRPLSIDVTPEVIQAYWSANERAGEFLPAALPDLTRTAVDRMRKFRPNDLTVNQVDPTFMPRGAVGLYILNGSASFRNVTIEPLGEAK